MNVDINCNGTTVDLAEYLTRFFKQQLDGLLDDRPNLDPWDIHSRRESINALVVDELMLLETNFSLSESLYEFSARIYLNNQFDLARQYYSITVRDPE